MKTVLFIGLSDKQNTEPLATGTKSGDIIDRIINYLGNDVTCIKSNLVNFAPLDSNNKLRYPNKNEMDMGYIALKHVIKNEKPDVCVCLGDKVGKYLFSKIDNCIQIHHPSYIAVYRRRHIEEYIKESGDFIFNRINKL